MINRLVRACALAGVCIYAGCESPTESVEFKVTARADVISDSAGTDVDVTLTLTNPSDVARTEMYGEDCVLTYSIQKADRTVMIPGNGGWFCGRILVDVTLQPGESVSRTARISSPAAPLPRGRYYVYGGIGTGIARRSTPAVFTLIK